MEETPWKQRIEAITHILTTPTTSPSLHSQIFISSRIPRYLHWDYPPVFCPSLHLRWGFSLFLKRISRFGLPETSWRCRCPYQQPPPLILAKGVEEARWDDEFRREFYARRRRVRRRGMGNGVNPWIPFLVPNLFLFSLLLWNPFPTDD